jgi:hypothetical protein
MYGEWEMCENEASMAVFQKVARIFLEDTRKCTSELSRDS